MSMLANPPATLAGRKLGVLVTDGADGGLLSRLGDAVKAHGATLEFVAPTVGGFTTSEGTLIEAQQKIDGGPSVLYDAVVILASAAGAEQLATDATTKDFVSDAFAHCKFIGYSPEAAALLEAAGVDPGADHGVVELGDERDDVEDFLDRCTAVRFWEREALVNAT